MFGVANYTGNNTHQWEYLAIILWGPGKRNVGSQTVYTIQYVTLYRQMSVHHPGDQVATRKIISRCHTTIKCIRKFIFAVACFETECRFANRRSF